jgi:ABC-type polysaccharide/polyol phosphate transport system ATPase subunit
MVDVRFEHVGKKYRLRAGRGSASKDRSAQWPRLADLWDRGMEFWALRDVSFAVRRGEALGIIGSNGAGKSTVLKLLAHITTPTRGEITIDGRLSALIEIGSGFHPELTGRENVYLNGSLLGMPRREIALKLDDIVEFAGVRQFIDMPLKRYSSGMYVRLGFAIAAHLNGDILLLDEVLAVGDAAFQSRCIQRIDELRSGGRTIVFVSHDLGAVERLCDRVLLLQHGQIMAEGKPADIVHAYQQAVSTFDPSQARGALPGSRDRTAEIARVSLRDACGRKAARFRTGQALRALIHYTAYEHIEDASFSVVFFTADNQPCCQLTTEGGAPPLRIRPGAGTLEFLCPELGLVPGLYYVDVGIKRIGTPDGVNLHWLTRCLVVRVDPGKIVRGKFHMCHTWQHAQRDDPSGRTELRSGELG